MHTLLDYDCLLPEFVNIIDEKVTGNKAVPYIPVPPHSVIAYRGYCNYGLLKHWDSNDVFFLVRHKDNIRYRTVEERPLSENTLKTCLLTK